MICILEKKILSTKKKKISRGKKRKKNYFTKEHENAIIQYNVSECKKEREVLYRDTIQPVMSQMVDKIVLTFKFTNLANIETLKEECKAFIVTVLCKFDPSKKSTAFSYFSIVIKNWFIAKIKKQKKRQETEVQIVDLNEFVDYSDERLIVHNPYHELREKKEFFDFLDSEFEEWKDDLDEDDKKVLCALQEVFQRKEELSVFSRKGIYVYLREITNFKTPKISKAIKNMKEKYLEAKEFWVNEHNW